jgi:uncharacterized protein (TIGR03067 family)
MNRTVTEGAKKGNKSHGIYELEGDTLRECWISAHKERPKEFTSKDGAMLIVFKRVKP